MELFNHLFGKKNDGLPATTPKEQLPAVQEGSSASKAMLRYRFGRYTDSNKTAAQLAHWNDSIAAFARKEYLNAFRSFFYYLKDEEIGNMQFKEQAGKIEFEILQGSKTVVGSATTDAVIAEAGIARYDKLPVPVMRRMLEMNYSNRYARYAVNDQKVLLRFDSHAMDASPEKLYYALKEVALKADKQDDLLLAEFKSLQAINTAHILPMSEAERNHKLKYFRLWTRERLDRARALHLKPGLEGGLAYLLLNLIYKLDYLLSPEGKLMNALENMNLMYWRDDKRKTEEKNADLIAEFEKLMALSDDEISNSFLHSKACFGLVNPATFQSVQSLITEQSNRYRWYVENNYADIATDLLEYIAGYSFFNYGLKPEPAAFLHLIYRVTQSDFFSDLGEVAFLDTKTMQLQLLPLQQQLDSLIQEAKKVNPQLMMDPKKIVYSNLHDWLFTYYQELSIQNL